MVITCSPRHQGIDGWRGAGEGLVPHGMRQERKGSQAECQQPRPPKARQAKTPSSSLDRYKGQPSDFREPHRYFRNWQMTIKETMHSICWSFMELLKVDNLCWILVAPKNFLHLGKKGCCRDQAALTMNFAQPLQHSGAKRTNSLAKRMHWTIQHIQVTSSRQASIWDFGE
jgi:hypothetical protein